MVDVRYPLLSDSIVTSTVDIRNLETILKLSDLYKISVLICLFVILILFVFGVCKQLLIFTQKGSPYFPFLPNFSTLISRPLLTIRPLTLIYFLI